jgi:hypothetical protein
LHEGVYPQNPRNYAVFAESYIEMILKLRAEIDAFLGIAPQAALSPEENGCCGDGSEAASTRSASERVPS